MHLLGPLHQVAEDRVMWIYCFAQEAEQPVLEVQGTCCEGEQSAHSSNQHVACRGRDLSQDSASLTLS